VSWEHAQPCDLSGEVIGESSRDRSPNDCHTHNRIFGSEAYREQATLRRSVMPVMPTDKRSRFTQRDRHELAHSRTSPSSSSSSGMHE
jgi:hypothetical protein